MSEQNIPDVLREAARIFLKELESHVAFINTAVANGAPIEAAAMERRFHLIRGASGFLGMKALQALAKEAEHLYRDESVTLPSEEIRARTMRYLAELETHRASLATELAA